MAVGGFSIVVEVNVADGGGGGKKPIIYPIDRGKYRIIFPVPRKFTIFVGKMSDYVSSRFI